MESLGLGAYDPLQIRAFGVFAALIGALVVGALTPLAAKHKAAFGLSALPSFVLAGALLLWGLLLAVLVSGLFLLVFQIIAQPIVPRSDGTLGRRDPLWDWRFKLVQVAALTTVLGAVVVLPITLNRLRLQREGNETAAQVLDKEREALFNDKINAATTDLYARRQRSLLDGGGRLFGLVEERPDVAERVSRLLSIYVRELSAPGECPPKVAPDFESKEQIREWAHGLKPRSDMENAVQTLGQLRGIEGVADEDVKIDLRRANLQGVDFKEGNFDNALLQYAHVQGADLIRAQWRGADLAGARLHVARLTQAQLQGADLTGAQLQEAYLTQAQLQGASLTGAGLLGAYLLNAQLQKASLHSARLQSATLTRAQVQGANLGWVQLEGTDLTAAQLQGADLTSAHFLGAFLLNTQLQKASLTSALLQGSYLHNLGLSSATDLTYASLHGCALSAVDAQGVTLLEPFWEEVFADGSIEVPEGKERPAHWVDEILGGSEFRGAWRAWQARIGQDADDLR